MRQASAPAAPVLYADSADGTLIAYRVFVPLPNVGETARHADERGLTRRVGADAPTDGDDGEADASGVPVLLVHGFASNGRVTWEGTGWVSALTDAGRTVITVDLRGHGASDKPAEASAYDPAALGDDLVAVLDSADVDRVDVIAYSMGNRVLSAFVTAAPERVRRAVVGGAGPDELFASWDLDEARALLLRDEPVATVLIEQVLRPAIDAGADREALLACIEGVAGAPLALPGGLPVLFVAGELDPVPTGVEGFASARGSDVLRIPGRDHVSTLTSREFKTAALAFLA